MDDLKNCSQVQRPRKREERKEKKKRMVVSDKLVNLFMHALLFHGEHVETHWEQPRDYNFGLLNQSHVLS
jgi:hypothetical protein